MFGAPNKGSNMGKAIPTPMAGEPEIAPMNKGTIIAMASTGTPDSITTFKRPVTEPVISIMSLEVEHADDG